MIRKSAIIVIGVVVVLGGAWAWLASSGTLERVAEMAISRLARTEVELNGVNLALLDMQGAMESMRVENPEVPEADLMTTGKAAFDINGMQLFAQKLVINQIKLEDLVLRPDARPEPPPETTGSKAGNGNAGGTSGTNNKGGTPAEAPSAEEDPGVKETLKNKWKESSGKLKEDMPIFNPDLLAKELNVEELVRDDGLASVEAYDKAAKMSDERTAYWDAELEKADLSTRADKVSANAKGLNISGIKTPARAKAAQKQLSELTKGVKSLYADSTRIGKGSKADYDKVRKALAEAKALQDKDVAAAKRLMGLGGINTKEAGKLIFGNAVLSQFDQIMGYLAKGREMIGKEESDARPARRAGREIAFPVTNKPLPNFLMRKAFLTGTMLDEQGKTRFDFDAEVRGMASSARVYGLPTEFEAKVLPVDAKKAWVVKGMLDHRDDPVDEVTLLAKGVKLGDMNLGKKEGGMMPGEVRSPNGNVNLRVKLEGDRMDGVMEVLAKKLDWRFSPPAKDASAKKKQLAREIKDIFMGVKAVKLKARMRGTLDNPDFSVSSDMDAIFANSMKRLMGKRAKAAEDRIRAAVDKRVGAKRRAAEKKLAQGEKKVKDQIQKARNATDKASAALKAKRKELEKKLKNLGGSKAKEALKNLFKK